MTATIPPALLQTVSLAHASWHPAIFAGLDAMMQAHPDYLAQLVNTPYLPTASRLLAAFAQPLDAVRYVLVGEGPYPRAASATGVCFMDGAVDGLWSDKGLSKQVNRATSLRNFIKMLLVADGTLVAERSTGAAIEAVGMAAQQPSSGRIQRLSDLQANLHRHGFLLLNASLVFRPEVKPVLDARAWQPFLRCIFAALAKRTEGSPTLVLWGKIAAQFDTLTELATFPRAAAEHPYNLSFIGNQAMQQLFGPMQLLKARLTT